MKLPEKAVIAASNAWNWVPDTATAAETDEYLIARFPDHFDHPLEVVRFTPAGPVADAMETVLERAREYGLPKLWWMVRLDSPPGVGELLAVRGATVDEILDVLATDLSDGAPELPPPATEAELRWAADPVTIRDGLAVGAEVFGGSVAPDDWIEAESKRAAADIPAGKGGIVVAYAGGVPVAVGSVTMTDDGVARLWFAAVVAPSRGQGFYRAILAARLAYAAHHGATMALVKGRVETSGSILRRAGFAAYGQELIYAVSLD